MVKAVARDLIKPDYVYRATLNRVIDGDTIDVDVDLGFGMKARKRLRFLEIDTEELRGGTDETKSLARDAKARVQELCDEADQIWVQTMMDARGKYGRLLAYVWFEKDGVITNLNTLLVEEGYEKVRE